MRKNHVKGSSSEVCLCSVLKLLLDFGTSSLPQFPCSKRKLTPHGNKEQAYTPFQISSLLPLLQIILKDIGQPYSYILHEGRSHRAIDERFVWNITQSNIFCHSLAQQLILFKLYCCISPGENDQVFDCQISIGYCQRQF